jgi:predicted acetyltransferase
MSGLEVIAATDADRATVANLIQLYLYDMTDEGAWPIGEDGRYGYDFLERFWRYPYLLRVDGELAGFALVIDECPLTGDKPCWFMAEFFVMRGYRRRGVGRQAVGELLSRHPGRWHIGVMRSHERAETFWSGTLGAQAELSSRVLMFDGDGWRLRSFVADAGSPDTRR